MSRLCRILLLCAFCTCGSTLPAAGMEPSFFPPQEREKEGRTAQQIYPGVQDVIRSACLETAGGRHAVVIHYPVGLGEGIDSEMARLAGYAFDDGFTRIQERSKDSTLEQDDSYRQTLLGGRQIPGSPTQTPEEISMVVMETYEVGRPSPRFVSLRVRKYAYLLGIHDYWEYESRTFDLLAGGCLELRDIFPKPKKSLPLLTKRIAQGILEQKNYLSAPPALTVKEADITISRLFLTLEGLQVSYAPYEQDPLAKEDLFITIPKEELPALGADMRFWQPTYTITPGTDADKPGLELFGMPQAKVNPDSLRISSNISGANATVRYPRDLGHPAFTAMAESIAKALWMESADQLYPSTPEEPLPEGISWYSNTRWMVSASSPRRLSLIFETFELVTMTRNYWEYTTLSFDLDTGKEITMWDIFPPGESYNSKILPALMPRIRKAFQEGRFEDEYCTLEDGASISTDKLVLTEEGLDILYSSGEERGCGYGPVRVSLPKKELIELGVSPRFWSSGPGSEAGSKPEPDADSKSKPEADPKPASEAGLTSAVGGKP